MVPTLNWVVLVLQTVVVPVIEGGAKFTVIVASAVEFEHAPPVAIVQRTTYEPAPPDGVNAVLYVFTLPN
jgi:hypothetical protein